MKNQPVDLPYLPDDLLLNCLARVSVSNNKISPSSAAVGSNIYWVGGEYFKGFVGRLSGAILRCCAYSPQVIFFGLTTLY